MVRFFLVVLVVVFSGCAYTDGMKVNMKPNADSVDFTVDFFGSDMRAE